MRYAETRKYEPACPYCAAHGIETRTRDASGWGNGSTVEICDGGTEPLAGILCASCEAEGVG